MDRRELRNVLLGSGLSPESFELQDVHEHVPVPPDFWFLCRASDGRWEIGLYERGVHDVRETHDTEDAACRALHQALTGRPAPS
jgi:hypothetical protein